MRALNNVKRSTKYTLISWVLVVLWAVFIFSMSSNTSTGLNTGLGVFSQIYQVVKSVQASLLGPDVDVLSSIAHFCEYTFFAVLLTNALSNHMTLSRAVPLAIACASLYGVTDEIHQLFVPGRMCDPLDWLVDTVGATVGSFIAYAAIKKGRSGRTQPSRESKRIS